jgi:hypothetical protein
VRACLGWLLAGVARRDWSVEAATRLLPAASLALKEEPKEGTAAVLEVGECVYALDPSGAWQWLGFRRSLPSLNTGIGFEVGDVLRLPLFKIDDADAIIA